MRNAHPAPQHVQSPPFSSSAPSPRKTTKPSPTRAATATAAAAAPPAGAARTKAQAQSQPRKQNQPGSTIRRLPQKHTQRQLGTVLVLSLLVNLWVVAQLSMVGWMAPAVTSGTHGNQQQQHQQDPRETKALGRDRRNQIDPSRLMVRNAQLLSQYQKQPLAKQRAAASAGDGHDHETKGKAVLSAGGPEPVVAQQQHPGQRPKQQPRQQPLGKQLQDETGGDPDLVHILHTRFMQHQGNLTTLGLARLEQFLAFCLPTMVHQTTQNFFWIIKVDPLLYEEGSDSLRLVFRPLLEAIEASRHENDNANNIYLVGSNYNHNLQGHGSWRDGQEGDELRLEGLAPMSASTSASATEAAAARGDHHRANGTGSAVPSKGSAPVFSGDLARLRRAHELRESLPVLETRLDADDGLHRGYLERVQTMALRRFLGGHGDGGGGDTNGTMADAPAPPRPRWLYWCIQTQIEWHSDNNNDSLGRPGTATEPRYHGNSTLGYLRVLRNDKYCITPGITVGYGVGLKNTTANVPWYQHTKMWAHLHNKYKFCHSHEDRHKTQKGPCLELMGKAGGENRSDDGGHGGRGETRKKRPREPFVLHALRSRTLTSAGMLGILPGNSSSSSSKAKTKSGRHNREGENDQASDSNDEDLSVRMQAVMWRVLALDFGIDPERVRSAQEFLSEHRVAIAEENRLGQCTAGHSCKDEARERLETIVRNGG